MMNRGSILVIDNDPVDALNAERTIKAIDVALEVSHATDCEQALLQLRARRLPRPMLILLDLDGPGMPGLEFLKILKNDKALQPIPLVVLSRTNYEHRVATSFALGAAGYILKSDNYEEMSEEISIVVRYWGLSLLPPAYQGLNLENTYLAS